MGNHHVVLLSGGIDSTVVLAMFKDRGYQCTAVTFNYGQKHYREILAAGDIAIHYEVEHVVVSVPKLFGPSALLGQKDMPVGHAESPDATVVPARNIVFLAMGAAIADARGASGLAFGANADDAAGYPDCRRGFIESMRDSIQVGTDHHVWLQAPLLSLNKSEIVQAGYDLDVPFDLTWSCYQGGEEPCGSCGACVSRAEGMSLVSSK